MKNLLFAGVATTSMLMISPAMAANDSFASKAESGKSTSVSGIFEGRRDRGRGTMPHVGPRPGGHGPGIGGPGMGGNHRWGHRIGGRWFAGFHAPGGWNGYRAPFRGFTLPTYWVQPSYRIVNFPTYGLYAPQTGYGWSRYYDDAVLTDGNGYVQDHRSNIPWDRYEGGYTPENYPEPDFGPAMRTDPNIYDDDGRAYARQGNPLPAQQQVEFRQGTGQQEFQQNGYDPRYDSGGNPSGQGYRSRYGFEDYERCLSNRGVTGALLGTVVGGVIGNRVSGRGDRLAGTLAGAGVGALLGRGIEKAAKKCKKYLPRDDRYYYDQSSNHGQPQYAPPPPPQPQGNPYGYQGGYYQNGWYYPAPTVTTITVSPAVTTTTTTIEEYYYETVAVPAKKKAVRKWKAKPKPRCGCR
jgi:Ni/Co efflux regulator RcnB